MTMRLRFLFFALTTASVLSMPAQTTPLPASTPLGAAVFEWTQLAAKPTKTGERRNVFDAPTATLANLECHVTTLNPGETPHAPHRHPDEEIIVVKEGTLEVTIAGQMQRAGPGSVIFYASNVEHGLRNVGPSPATYHVFRWTAKSPPAFA
jgi:quercetin dioxygenase-like cupin family protein